MVSSLGAKPCSSAVLGAKAITAPDGAPLPVSTSMVPSGLKRSTP